MLAEYSPEQKDVSKHNFAFKTNLAVSSTEFCQAIFDERDIRRGLGCGSGHGMMMPLES